MESLPDQSPNTKPSFRKPSNDATGRKYRRHSPVGGSDSSASDDSLKIVRRHDAIPHKEDKTKMADKNRKDDSTDFDRDYHSRSRRDDDSHRHSYSSSHGYRRNEDRARDSRSFHSGRESRDSHYSSRMRKENDFDRLRETSRSTDKYSRDRSDNGEHRSKDRDRDTNVTQRHKYNDKGSISMDRDRHRDRETRDDRKERRKSPENYKKDPPYEGSRSRIRESGFVKDSDSADFKETSNSRDKNKQDDMPSKRKLDEKEYRRNKVAYDREADEDKTSPWKKNKSDHQSENAPGIAEDQPLPSVADDGKPKESSKQDKETNSRFSSGPIYPSTDQAETADDLGAAKFAAMKAAEIVNRNLMGGGLSTTEQKKKLLWGNKKNTTVEESSSQWDLSLFPDKERQEKFKKLMSLRLPWCLWPIVGCERRPEAGAQAGRQGHYSSCEAARGAPDGPRKAVHCRPQAKRWSNCWSWSVTSSVTFSSLPTLTVLGKYFHVLLFWKYLGLCSVLTMKIACMSPLLEIWI